MAKDKELPETGTFKLPKEGGEPERVAPIPGIEQVQAKMLEGAKLHELDDLERRKVEIKAYRDDEARILEAAALEAGPPTPVIPKEFGVLGDMKTRFVLLHEQVGPFNRNIDREVTYMDLAEWDVKGDHRNGFMPDYQKPLIRETKAKVDRLIAIGAIRPLVLVGRN